MRGAGRIRCGLLLSVVMIAGSTAAARAETQPTTATTVEAVAPTTSEAAGPAAMSSTDTDPDRAGANADANATDWAAPDPARYPQLDVPTKPWAYDTIYFFALTRGLDEERLSTWGRRASMVGTVPLDVVGLPTAALAGLFGS